MYIHLYIYICICIGIVVPVVFSVQIYGSDYPYFEFSQMSDKSLFFTKNSKNKKTVKKPMLLTNSEMDNNTVKIDKISTSINKNSKIIDKNSTNVVQNSHKNEKNSVKFEKNSHNSSFSSLPEKQNMIFYENSNDNNDYKNNTGVENIDQFDPAGSSSLYFPTLEKKYNHINNTYNLQLGTTYYV
jgi:hypothetical protein